MDTSDLRIIDRETVFPFCAAVGVFIRGADWGMLPFGKDECRAHVFGQVTDLHFLGDELHGDVIAGTVNGDGGVFPYLAGDAV